jgi:general secretion pathway protein F
MKFRVLGVDEGAAPQIRIVDAIDAGAARRLAASLGLAVLEVEPVAGSREGARAAAFNVDLFCQELLALLTAGVSVGEALETLVAKDTGARRDVVETLLRSVREGQPLSAALARRADIFPVLLTESLRAAERTSDYGPALARFVRYRALSRAVREKLLSASIYPLILLGVSSLVLLFLLGYVVPRFADVYKDMGDRLPAASRVMLWMGQAIGGHPWMALGALAFVAASGVAAIRSARVRSMFVSLLRRLPRVRDVLAAAEFARLYRTLALLIHGGIPMVASLHIVRGMLSTTRLTQRLDLCRRSVSEGRSFSASMAEQGLSTVVADRFFRVGEGSGKLAEMIDRAADFHEEEVSRGADWLGRFVGPVMMLVMGTLIGLVVVLMYMPIFELAEAIQ